MDMSKDFDSVNHDIIDMLPKLRNLDVSTSPLALEWFNSYLKLRKVPV